jgi:nitroreductase
MDFVEVVKTRMSVRAYKPDPVPREVLEKVIDTALWSPSGSNTQPWELAVVAGEQKKELDAMLQDCVRKGVEPKPDVPIPQDIPEKMLARRNAVHAKLGEYLAPPEPGTVYPLEMFRFFDAPAAIIVWVERSMGDYSTFDAGLFVQTLMLSAVNEGLGTCAERSVILFSDQIREFLNIPQSKKLLLGLAVGYPDPEAPINSARTDRVGVNEFTTWLGI